MNNKKAKKARWPVLPGLQAAIGAASIASALALTGQSAVAQDVKGDANAAKGKISMCVGCHSIPGYKSSFPTVFPVPMIAGQSEAYIASALKSYRKGDRSHPSMSGIAGSLTDQDIADLAAYFAKYE